MRREDKSNHDLANDPSYTVLYTEMIGSMVQFCDIALHLGRGEQCGQRSLSMIPPSGARDWILMGQRILWGPYPTHFPHL